MMWLSEVIFFGVDDDGDVDDDILWNGGDGERSFYWCSWVRMLWRIESSKKNFLLEMTFPLGVKIGKRENEKYQQQILMPLRQQNACQQIIFCFPLLSSQKLLHTAVTSNRTERREEQKNRDRTKIRRVIISVQMKRGRMAEEKERNAWR